MKVVILAGGFGTRISEESHIKPKPMIEIGGKPILWHIMKIYSAYGFNEFVICCGYKAEVIKQYFANYFLLNCDVSFDYNQNNMVQIHNNINEPWKVTVVDTGLNTMTGGRIKRIQPYINNEPFMITYGDGVSNVNISELVKFHENNGELATITVIKPEARFGIADIKGNYVTSFREKSQMDIGWINGGFMVVQPDIFNYIKDDSSILEKDCLGKLSEDNCLTAYKHNGFWQCMDTQRDKQRLEQMWANKEAPWKVW